MKAKNNFLIKVLGLIIISILTVSLSNTEVYGAPETLLLFDDFFFQDNIVWKFATNSTGSFSITDGVLAINSGTISGSGASIKSLEAFPIGDETLVFEARIKMSSDHHNSHGFNNQVACRNNVVYGNSPYFFDTGEVTGLAAITSVPGNVRVIDLSDIDTSIWHVYRIEHFGDHADYYVDDQWVATHTEGLLDCPMNLILSQSSPGGNHTVWIDYVRLTAVAASLEIAIDVKPSSDPNCFNNNGHGVIPVAILSSVDFDATQVDPTTVELDGQAIRVAGRKGKLQSHIEDSNGDGIDDLVVQIEDEDGTYEEDDTVATLTGETFDGTQIQGTDTICIVP